MTAIPHDDIPPTGATWRASLADLLNSTATSARRIPADHFHPGHEHADTINTLSALVSAAAQIAMGLEMEAGPGTTSETARDLGRRMTDCGLAATAAPHLQQLLIAPPRPDAGVPATEARLP